MGNADWSLSLFLVAALTVTGCGKPAAPAKSAAPDTEAVAETKDDESPPEKSGPNCSDGTCITCGDAECPKGFFCDESTSKPTCQWVPACAESVSCSCVERSLSGNCTCTERDGGSYVRCDG
ncbi:MAG: hypothetical protein ACM3ZE_23810 [Myxococcales bacterium]